MPTYIALLRGINVGKAKRVAMIDLREIFNDLGHTDVVTYINSGNVVFTAPPRNVGKLGAAVEKKIRERLGIDVKVVVLTREELARVIHKNPLHEAAEEPSRYYVVFLSGKPEAGAVAEIDPEKHPHDVFRWGEREVYIWYRGGESKLGNDAWEKRLGLVATSRNWNTVNKLLELASS